MNDKVYIHELVDVIGHNRAKYMHHVTANWCPIARAERNQLCFGVWGTIGSTGHWPEVVNIWEVDGWDGLASDFAHEVGHAGLQDPSLADWWAAAASLRRGGLDRLVVPAPWSPTIGELLERGMRGEVYAHELLSLEPGAAPELLERLASHGRAVMEAAGAELVAAFRVTMCNDTECIIVWAFRDWPTWARFEQEDTPQGTLAPWRRDLIERNVRLRRTLMSEAPLSPMRIGRQPDIGDRKPLSEL